VAYLEEVLTDPLTKKQSLITTIKEFFSNIPREATGTGGAVTGTGGAVCKGATPSVEQ
jgi:hypothetical protein